MHLDRQDTPNPSVLKQDDLWIWDRWYVALEAKDLGSKPVRRMIMATAIVFFRDDDRKPVAILDACGHRRAPLSQGRIINGQIECPFHGWRYDARGICRMIPALPDQRMTCKLGKIPAFPVKERQGFIWVFMGSFENATRSEIEPHRFPCSKYSSSSPHIHYHTSFQGDYLTILETNLDFTHTSFVHAGLVRNSPCRQVVLEVQRKREQVEFHLTGEKELAGSWFALLRWLSGTNAYKPMHIDRFIVPSISETTYEWSPRFGITFSEALTPVSRDRTDLFGCMTLRLPVPLPRILVQPLLKIRVRRIFEQDKRILKLAHTNAKTIANPTFSYSKADVYRHEIALLLQNTIRSDTSKALTPIPKTSARRLELFI